MSAWTYKAMQMRPSDSVTVMRYRSEPELCFEITNVELGEWIRADELGYTVGGADNWDVIDEEEARSVPGLDWFDAEAPPTEG